MRGRWSPTHACHLVLALHLLGPATLASASSPETLTATAHDGLRATRLGGIRVPIPDAERRSAARATADLGVPGVRRTAEAQAPRRRPAAADSTVVVGRVLGRGTGQPVEGAVVRLRDGRALDGAGEPDGQRALSRARYEALTDTLGWFAFPAVAPGEWVLEVERIGYGSQTDSLRVPAGETLELTIRMAARAVAVDPLEVTVLSDVERRRRAQGHPHHIFITREEIERYFQRGAIDIGDVLRRHDPNAVRVRRVGLSGGTLPGVCIESSRAVTRLPIRPRNSTRQTVDAPGCRMVALAIDGMLVAVRKEAIRMAEVRDLSPDAVERIEFLPPTDAIFRYGMFGANGVLSITTRTGAGGPDAATNPTARTASGEEVAVELRERLERQQRTDRWRYWAIGGLAGLGGGVALGVGRTLSVERCHPAECSIIRPSLLIGLAAGLLSGEIALRIRR